MKSREHGARIEKVQIDSLRVPPSGKAQRPFREAKGDRIAAEFDIDSFGFPVICRVEDTNWIVDGQHRVYAIQKCGYAKATDSIECEVYQGLTMAEMARMFLGRNRTTPVTAYERFGVAVTAGYETERAITEIVESVGLKIGYPKTEGNVFSVGALRRVYDQHGAETLRRVLQVLRDAYNSHAGFNRQMIEGLALVLATYTGIDEKVLMEGLGMEPHGVAGVQRRAEQYRERLGRQVPECIAAGIVDIYNRRAGKRQGLIKWWKAQESGRLHHGRTRRSR